MKWADSLFLQTGHIYEVRACNPHHPFDMPARDAYMIYNIYVWQINVLPNMQTSLLNNVLQKGL